MAQKTPEERRLTIIRLLDTQWIVYDLDENSFLCSTVEFPIYQPGVDRLYVNMPIPFTTHAYAQEIIDGKQTIGGLQQILNNLRVGFQKEIGYPTCRETTNEVVAGDQEHPHRGTLE